MNGFEVTEVMDVLSKRKDFIKTLQEGPKTKDQLLEQLDVSRRTVYRVLDDMEEKGLISSLDDEKYKLTVYGNMAFEEFKGMEHRLKNMYESQKLLSSLPSEKSIHPVFLNGAEIMISESQKGFDKLLDDLEMKTKGVNEIKLFVSKIPDKRYIDIFYDKIINDGVDTELIIDPTFVEYLVFDYLETSRNALECSNLEVLKTREDLPFALALLEKNGIKIAGIGIWGAEGEVSGLIWNKTREGVGWAEETYEKYREESDELDVKAIK